MIGRSPAGPIGSLRMTISPSLVTVLFTIALQAQDTRPASSADAAKEARDRALAKTRSQLEQKPTHAQVFDYWFKLLVESNAVEGETAALAKKLEAEPGETTTSIILGKLYLRTGKEEKALETL